MFFNVNGGNAEPENYFPTNVSSVRLVAWGVRLKNLLPFNTITGAGAAASVPLLGQVPAKLFTTATASQSITSMTKDQITTQYLGMMDQNLDTIRQIPDSHLFTMGDLVDKTLVVKTRPTDVRGTFWKAARATVPAVANLQIFDGDEDIVWNPIAGRVEPGVTSLEYENIHGFQAAIVQFFGLPNSTSFAEVEIVFHWEAVETPTSANAPLPVTERTSVAGDVMSILGSVTTPVIQFMKNPDVQASLVGAMKNLLIGSNSHRPNNFRQLL